jgi:hypothetical protein
MSGTEHFGYTEPFCRFVQYETLSPQANEIPNTAPSWSPGDDYYAGWKRPFPVFATFEKDSSQRGLILGSREAKAGFHRPPEHPGDSRGGLRCLTSFGSRYLTEQTSMTSTLIGVVKSRSQCPLLRFSAA